MRSDIGSCFGRVTTNWFGFYRIWKASNQIFDTVELTLPAYSYESQAAWIRIPLSVKTAVEAQNLPLRAGSHAASHALLNVVPMYMMCNVSDLGTECANPHDARAIPERLLLYDRHPGGIGITLQVQILFGELLIAALELVSICSCSSSVGCPNCIQTLSCGEYNEVLDKETAIVILKGVIESERSYFQSRRVLASFLGIVARNANLTPLHIPDWRAFPMKEKRNILKLVKSKFSILTRGEKWVLRSLGKKWKDYKCQLKSEYYLKYKNVDDLLENRPERVPRDQWTTLVSFWNSEKVKRKESRKSWKTKMPHTAGSKSFARLTAEKTKDGAEPSRVHIFIETHKPRKDGRPIDNESLGKVFECSNRNC
uniref:MrfA-like Zn-binding domain-containing protein n=1 Tax=Ananas comosus var. bracteatus TaxID=296719 RepID=A0A6V7NHP5_ANACO|nr:unnamed protein product [Ananas comosus var. bracteatus]